MSTLAPSGFSRTPSSLKVLCVSGLRIVERVWQSTQLFSKRNYETLRMLSGCVTWLEVLTAGVLSYMVISFLFFVFCHVLATI